MTKIGQMRKGAVGRPEKISKDQAQKICRMIERMADAQIPVNWVNVIAHAKKYFRVTYTRGILSQYNWDGRKLIAEAFNEAKAVQKRMQRDSFPKYKSAPRSVLQKRIMELEAKVLVFQDELEKERAQKVDAFDTFLNTRCDLQRLIEQRAKELSKGGTDEFADR